MRALKDLPAPTDPQARETWVQIFGDTELPTFNNTLALAKWMATEGRRMRPDGTSTYKPSGDTTKEQPSLVNSPATLHSHGSSTSLTDFSLRTSGTSLAFSADVSAGYDADYDTQAGGLPIPCLAGLPVDKLDLRRPW